MHGKLTMYRISMLLILFLLPSAAPAQRCISVIPDTTVVTIDMQFSLDVGVNDLVDSLMGYDITVGFDRSLLEVVRVEEGSLPAASGHPTFFIWLNEGCTCDSIFVNGSILDGTVDGPGILFSITFKALGLGKAAVDIRRSDLRNGINQVLPHTVENGLVIIEPPIGAERSSWSRVKTLYK